MEGDLRWYDESIITNLWNQINLCYIVMVCTPSLFCKVIFVEIYFFIIGFFYKNNLSRKYKYIISEPFIFHSQHKLIGGGVWPCKSGGVKVGYSKKTS